MKFILPALLAFTALPSQAADYAYLVQNELRAECAKSYAEYGGNYAGAQYYGKDYSRESNGDYRYGQKYYKACDEAQYASYLDRADPTKVMAAYPTAAGRPTVKKDEKKDDKKPASPK